MPLASNRYAIEVEYIASKASALVRICDTSGTIAAEIVPIGEPEKRRTLAKQWRTYFRRNGFPEIVAICGDVDFEITVSNLEAAELDRYYDS